MAVKDSQKIEELRLFILTVKIDNSIMAESNFVEKAVYFAVSGFKKSTLLPSFFTELNTFIEHLLKEYSLGRTNIGKVTELLEQVDRLIKSRDFQKVYKPKKGTYTLHEPIAKFYRLKSQFENSVSYTKKSFLSVVPLETKTEVGSITSQIVAEFNTDFESALRTPDFLYRLGAAIKKIERHLKANPSFEDPDRTKGELNRVLERHESVFARFPKNRFTGFFSPYHKEEVKQVIESRTTLESIRALMSANQ